MDWRMRRWDIDFCTEILDQKLPIEWNQIIPVGGRGTKLNLTREQLVIPSMRPDLVPTIGRGRPITDSKQTLPGRRLPSTESEDLRGLSDRMVQKRMLSKLKDDYSWPSLSTLSTDTSDVIPDSSISLSIPSLSIEHKLTETDTPKKKGSKGKKKGVLISSTTHRNSFK